ncbi:MAG TPA: Ppx/GppA phosphatase family protein [Noviherbaspirillum sp.]|uniref:Ppx/GppA phosphatase family protein n=1 Tax=Noviherbaspirillum sp. TaxID=1926288 RepID=UPI002D454E6B|nr:Ppx/GppA phosphatase family protein [Noviherbaspirillum sp.]HYD96359.1 Ppx/GppA phosphatase family protein [Noviherbaspirillum sp.]
MFAAVDLGSNSFRLHIGKQEDGQIRILKSARDPIRLGAGLDAEGNLTEQAMRTALESLKGFRTILGAYPLQAVRVVATNTLRVAKNAAAFLPRAEAAIGHPIEVISGEEEGRLIYMGVACALAQQDEPRLVIDIGGGSTELILGDGAQIRHVESFSIGTVPHSRSFFPGGRIDAASFDAAVLSARSQFEDAAPLYDPKLWTAAYGSSGTIRAIAEAIAKNGIGDGTMSQKSLDALRKRLIAFGDAAKVELAGIKPERVNAVAGGLAILIGVMRELRVPAIGAVDAGLRMGVLWDLQLRASQRDRREQSVQEFLQRFHVSGSRALQVARAAAALYGSLKPTSDALVKYLYWGGQLHEVGLAVSHTGYHKHGAYLVENADLPGFTTREQRLMSALVLAQKGNLRKLGDALADPDFAKAVLALRLATIFLHARIDDDPGAVRLKMKSRIELELPGDWLDQHPTLSYWIDKERGWWGEVGVEMGVRTCP